MRVQNRSEVWWLCFLSKGQRSYLVFPCCTQSAQCFIICGPKRTQRLCCRVVSEMHHEQTEGYENVKLINGHVSPQALNYSSSLKLLTQLIKNNFQRSLIFPQKCLALPSFTDKKNQKTCIEILVLTNMQLWLGSSQWICQLWVKSLIKYPDSGILFLPFHSSFYQILRRERGQMSPT